MKAAQGQLFRAGGRYDMWGTAQALTSIISVPHLDRATVESALGVFDAAFDSERIVEAGGLRFGWRHGNLTYTQAEPTFWTISLLARALQQPKLLDAETRTKYRQRLEDAFSTTHVYFPLKDGGWNMLPRQTDATLHSHYTSVLALQALLDLRRAGLPYAGSVEARDALTAHAVAWLVREHVTHSGQSGWRGYRNTESALPFEGLSLQVYATLLRAAEEAGAVIPREFRDHVYDYLVRMNGRPFNPNRAAGTFRISFVPHYDREETAYYPVNYLWYPWAIECAARWLKTAASHAEAPERVTHVRRTLGYLVVDLKESMLEETLKEWPFVSAEILIGLSSIPRAPGP